MNRYITLGLALTMTFGSTLLLSQSSEAKPNRWNINGRQNRQQQRIANGIGDGQLSARESARLERKEARFNHQEARFRASGGGLSPKERLTMEREQNVLSHDIYRQKHDGNNR